jgi:hypothetical protein
VDALFEIANGREFRYVDTEAKVDTIFRHEDAEKSIRTDFFKVPTRFQFRRFEGVRRAARRAKSAAPDR